MDERHREGALCEDRNVSPALRVLSLFAGIGGIESGLAKAGIAETLGFYENWDPAVWVLRHRFPGTTEFGDIADLRHFHDADIVTAGFPCTDISQAGRTRGLDGLASGLVRKVLALLPAFGPEWLLIENVPNMLHLAQGRAMTEIISAIEDAGYSWAYRVIDSRSFGLRQRRRRVYLLASRSHDPGAVLFRSDEPNRRTDGASAGSWSDAFGFSWTEGNRGVGWAIDAVPTLKGSTGLRIPSPPAIWLPGNAPGNRIVTPSIEAAEILQGFAPGWTSAAPVRDRWKLVGNAVSVPVAEWIGQGIAGGLTDPDGFTDSLRIRPLIEDARWPRAASGSSEKRWTIDISEWPVKPSGKHLSTILQDTGTTPLSYRATKGFRDRLLRSSLRWRPEFMSALDAHVAHWSSQ